MIGLAGGLSTMMATIMQAGGIYCLFYAGWQVYKNFNTTPLKEKVENYFAKAGLGIDDIYPSLVRYDSNKNGDLFIYTIPPGMAFSQFEKKKEGLQHIFKSEIDLWNEKNLLFIRSYSKPIPEIIPLDDTEKELNRLMDNYELAIPIGQGIDKIYLHNLVKDPSHFLIAGTTRWGKTTFLKLVISLLMRSYTSQKVQLNLIDLKDGVSFVEFPEELPHIRNNIIEKSDTKIVVKSLLEEKKNRMDMLRNFKKENIKGTDLPWIITIIDEYAVVSDEIKDDVITLAQQGAAAGIILMIATQYPRNDVIDKLISVNCDVRISFYLKDSNASNVVLNNNLACSIHNKGRCIYQYGEDYEAQVPLINKQEIENIVNNNQVEQEVETKAGGGEIL